MSALSTRQRILGTIGLLVVVLLAVGIMGYRNSSKLNDALAFNYDNYFIAQTWVAEIIVRQRMVNEEILAAALARTPEATNATLSTVAETRSRIKKLWDNYQATDLTEEERGLAEDFTRSRQELLAVNDKVLTALREARFDDAAGLIAGESRKETREAMVRGERLLAYLAEHAADLKEQSDAMFRRSSRVMEVLIAVGVGVAVVLGWLLGRSIASALDHAMAVAAKIARGELGHDIRIDRRDEFGQLLQALKEMDTKLVEIVSQVRVSADNVGTSARQLAQGNDDLSGRTQEQAAALEETASSMEEMTATVKRNADNAKQANQLAVSARGQADAGGGIVDRAVQAMGEINMSSSKIADIISVIDEIAFQTNLLALNAAVEAARAGEQGRGFAVVASEVRTLAQRSAVAAKQIKDLIGDSVEKVKSGSDCVNESGKALAQILESVKKVGGIIGEISAASQEQAAGIDQVSNAVTQMDTATQQNAALVEQASAASKNMQMQAEELVRQVEFFRINGAASVRRERPHVADEPSRPVAHPIADRRPKLVASRPARAAGLARASGDGVDWQEF